jgi:uncharacterized protein (TIGR02145 family)/uncharacterized repeat protein (TIGR02543 family)
MAVILTAAAALFYSGCNDSADSDITGGGHVDDLIEKTRGTNEPKAYTLKVTVSPTVGGSVSKSPDKAQYSKGESVMLTATAKAGYRFTGWSGSQTSTGVEVLVKMDGNKELIANFLQENVVSYTLTINTSPTAGGSVSKSPDKLEYAAGDMVYVVAAPKPGYVFTIWSGSSSSKDSAITITMDSKKELTANFALATTTYTVTFSANGGGGTITGQSAKAGTNIILPDGSKLSRNGYTFGGWNTNNSGTGDFYSPGSSFSVTGNVTLYAVWNDVSAPTYTVNFNANGGTVSPTSAKTGDDGKLTSLPTPTRNGYSFDGWYTAETGGAKVELSRTYTANTTIYARWTLITYTIAFDANGGTVSSTSSTTNTDGKLASLPTPTRNGYTFDGWYTAETGGTKVELSRAYTANATIYARWTLITYTITFDANGGTVSPTSAKTGDDGKLASLPTPTRTGYTFDGWYANTAGGTEVLASRTYTANATIYARWTLITYTVTFDVNGGSGTVPSAQTVNAGSSITLPSQGSLTRTGYTFGGWNANSGGTGTNYDAGSSYTVNGNVMLYAKWSCSADFRKVVIGGKTWMAENLNCNVGNSECYNNSADSCAKYGRLYDWPDAMKACPAGWHLPSDAEWTVLTDAVGGSSTAGTKLKSTSGWYNNGNGTDDYGFAALPGGYDDSNGYFRGAGDSGLWWSSTEYNGYAHWFRRMLDNTEDVTKLRFTADGGSLLSVRCVED